MKKQNVNVLKLNKKLISNLAKETTATGGRTNRTCLLCCPSIDICPSLDCTATNDCTNTCQQTTTPACDTTDPILGVCI